MENRQPTYPGRVKLTPVPGQENTYDMERADEPTVEGTPLNKATLLQDATCAILDIPDTSVPNDAFVKLALGIGKYGYVIHVQYPDGSPAEGFTLTGLNAPDGTAAVTNANGDAVGVSTEQSVTVGVSSPYIDVNDIPAIAIDSTGILTNYTFTCSFNDSDYILIETSDVYEFSPKVLSFDITAVGGGGSGGVFVWGNTGSGGGGGGYISTLLNVYPSVDRKFTASIGAGGINNNNDSASDGGTTTFQQGQEVLLSAAGGKLGTTRAGGVGNGNGGAPDAPGENATGFLFNDSALGIPGGGGGGGAINQPGGSPYGGASKFPPTSGESGKGPGGGGAGGRQNSAGPTSAGNGHPGAIFLRIHY